MAVVAPTPHVPITKRHMQLFALVKPDIPISEKIRKLFVKVIKALYDRFIIFLGYKFSIYR